MLKNLKARANEVLGIEDGEGFSLGGPKLKADAAPPEWIMRLPWFTEQEAPKDISKLSNAWKETGKGGGGSTVLYTIDAKSFPPSGWQTIAKKDRTDTIGDRCDIVGAL
jgi:hypothetical protein